MNYKGATTQWNSDQSPVTYVLLGATLDEALDDSETAIDFTGTLMGGDVISIDSEQMLVAGSGLISTPATVTRGYNNTTAATHDTGKKIARRCPSLDIMMCTFKAAKANTGLIYLGGPGVIVPAAAETLVGGYEIEASQETPYYPIDNLNQVWHVHAVDADKLHILAWLPPIVAT